MNNLINYVCWGAIGINLLILWIASGVSNYNLEYLGNGRYQLYNHDTQEFSQPYDSIGKVLKELRLELSK